MNTRRQFLITAPLTVLGAAVACERDRQRATISTPAPPSTPGAPPTWGTAPAVGPVVTTSTVAEAEKLAQVTMTSAEREMMTASWRQSMAPLLERRVGPRRVALEPHVAPATRWNPMLAGGSAGPTRDTFVRS